MYSFRIDGESEESRLGRANSAFEDAQSRIGAFIVAKNVLLDGANLIPIHNQTLDGSTHAVGIARGLGASIEELHSIGVSTDVTGREHLVKSPATTLMALCGITLRKPEDDSYGNCYPMITDNTVQVGPDKWGYAFFTFPPEK